MPSGNKSRADTVTRLLGLPPSTAATPQPPGTAGGNGSNSELDRREVDGAPAETIATPPVSPPPVDSAGHTVDDTTPTSPIETDVSQALVEPGMPANNEPDTPVPAMMPESLLAADNNSAALPQANPTLVRQGEPANASMATPLPLPPAAPVNSPPTPADLAVVVPTEPNRDEPVETVPAVPDNASPAVATGTSPIAPIGAVPTTAQDGISATPTETAPPTPPEPPSPSASPDTPQPPASTPRLNDVTLEVSPPNRRGFRLVVAMSGQVYHRDEFNTDRATERRRFISDFAARLGVARNALLSLDQQIVEAAMADDAARDAMEQEEADNDDHDPLANVPEEDRRRARAYLTNPRMFQELAEDTEHIGIVGEGSLILTIYLVATSRLLDRPLSAMVQAASSSGKSHTVREVLTLFPPSEVIQGTSLTPQMLYYMPEGSLCHKIVMAAERMHSDARNAADIANAGLALRELISHGSIDKYLPMKSGEGEMRTVHIHQDGPVAYLETTTQETTFEEDATRLIALTTDESAEQTSRIMERQAADAEAGSVHGPALEAIRRKHQVAQLLLERLTVRIPYASRIRIPNHAVAARRAYPQLLSMIRAVALLRQHQKQVVNGCIEADITDYEVAHGVMLPVLRRVFMPANAKVLALFEIILECVGRSTLGRPFTRKDVREWSQLSDGTVRNRLKALLDAGMIQPCSGTQAKAFQYEVAPACRTGTPTLDGLPTPQELRRSLGLS